MDQIPRDTYVIIRLDDGEKATDAEWRTLLSRIEYVLTLHAPQFDCALGKVTKRAKPGDTKCPRQEKPLRAEDLI